MRLTKDLLAGVLFSVVGISAAIVALDYQFGSPAKMGPGFFPIVIAVMIAILGAVLIVQSLASSDAGELVEALHFRPLFFISVAIITFGFLVEARGLILALVALIVIGRLAGREGSLVELAVMVVVLIGVSVGIFVYGLDIYLRLWI